MGRFNLLFNIGHSLIDPDLTSLKASFHARAFDYPEKVPCDTRERSPTSQDDHSRTDRISSQKPDHCKAEVHGFLVDVLYRFSLLFEVSLGGNFAPFFGKEQVQDLFSGGKSKKMSKVFEAVQSMLTVINI